MFLLAVTRPDAGFVVGVFVVVHSTVVLVWTVDEFQAERTSATCAWRKFVR